MLIVIVLFATVLLRAAIVLTVIYLMLPRGRTCPRCAAELSAIRHPILDHVMFRVQHTWCLGCGWSGIVKHPHSRVINRAARS